MSAAQRLTASDTRPRGPLDPIDCTRCKRPVPVDEGERPEWIKTFVHAPITPRPVMPGGTRPDGTVVDPTPVSWLIEGDMDKPGSTVALLCCDCLELLRTWLYLGAAAPAVDGAGAR